MIRLLTMATALLFAGLAVAQSLPRFGTARFGEAVFGQASPGADALPVPFMPLWVTITWVLGWALRLLYSSRNAENFSCDPC